MKKEKIENLILKEELSLIREGNVSKAELDEARETLELQYSLS